MIIDAALPTSPTPDDCVYIMRRHIDILNEYRWMSIVDFFSGEGIEDPPESILQLQYDNDDITGHNVMKSVKNKKLSITHPGITKVPSIVSESLFNEIMRPSDILQTQITSAFRTVIQRQHIGDVSPDEYHSVLHEFFIAIAAANARRHPSVNQTGQCVFVNSYYLNLSPHRRRAIPIEVSEEEYYGDRVGLGISGIVNISNSHPRCYFCFSKQYYTDPVHYMHGVSVESLAVLEGFPGPPADYQPMSLDMQTEANWDVFLEGEDEEDDSLWKKVPQIYTPERLLQTIDIQTPFQYWFHRENQEPDANQWLFWMVSNYEDEVRERMQRESTHVLVNDLYKSLSPEEKRKIFVECSDTEYFEEGPIKDLVESKKREGKHCRVYTPHI